MPYIHLKALQAEIKQFLGTAGFWREDDLPLHIQDKKSGTVCLLMIHLLTQRKN